MTRLLNRSALKTPLLLLLLAAFTAYPQHPAADQTDLASSSKKAFLEMGMSEKYFDEHFILVNAIAKPGDLRVVWKYSLDGYEVIVNDAVGFYTTADNKKVYVHSVKNLLGSARDITRTISRKRAEQLMSRCIGNYGGEAIQYLRLYPSKAASIYLTAHGLPKVNKTKATEPPPQPTTPPTTGVDQRPARKGPRPRPLPLGYINLETGKCFKGTAAAAPIMQ
jgi:hypothetical protein